MRIKIIRHKPDSLTYFVGWADNWMRPRKRKPKIVFYGVEFCETTLTLRVWKNEYIQNEPSKVARFKDFEVWEEEKDA